MKKRINLITLLAMVILHSHVALSSEREDRLREKMDQQAMKKYFSDQEDDEEWDVDNDASVDNMDRLRRSMYQESIQSEPTYESEDDEEWDADSSDDEKLNTFDDNYFNEKNLDTAYFESKDFAAEFEKNMSNVRSFADQTIGFTVFMANIKEAHYDTEDITVSSKTLLNLAEIAMNYNQPIIAKKLLTIAQHQLKLLQSDLTQDLAQAMGEMDRSTGKTRDTKKQLGENIAKISKEHGETMESLEEVNKHMERADKRDKLNKFLDANRFGS